MVDLEIQALALAREGLLLETGRLAGTCGFTLVRQRLVPDPHGALLSMVVRGSWFKKRALKAALDGCDRYVSVTLLPAVADFHPHFGATRHVTAGYAPPPVPGPAPTATKPLTASSAPVVATAAAIVVPARAPAPARETKTREALVTRPPARTTAGTIVWEDAQLLDADTAAVDDALVGLARIYPHILPRVQSLGRTVAPGARVATLAAAGRRVGAWLAQRPAGPGAIEVVAGVALPALRDLVEVTLGADGALHILHSPLCQGEGHSGCGFYASLLEALLAPRGAWVVVPVCCASFGADECIIAFTR